MSLRLIYFVLLLSLIYARYVPNFSDLDEDEQHLFRAAYDAPSYNHEEYEDDLQPGKLDLMKDGLWAVKAKIKELKAFNKALAANLLATKLKVKDLLKNHLVTVKKHHHEKPSYNYEYHAPSYQAPPQYEYGAHQYAAPAPAYPEQQYALPYRHDPYYGH